MPETMATPEASRPKKKFYSFRVGEFSTPHLHIGESSAASFGLDSGRADIKASKPGVKRRKQRKDFQNERFISNSRKI